MVEKDKVPEVIKRKNSNKPIDYVKLNKTYKDFGKRFVPQQELLADEAFWYHMLNPSTKSSIALTVKIEAPKELPNIILVNESLKKLKLHLANFDKVVKIRTTPNARIEGKWGFEHTKAVFSNEIILFLKSLKDIFNVFDKDLLNEIMEVQTVFDQMDVAVQQSSVDEQRLEIYKIELLLEIDRLLQQIMSQDVLLTVMNFMSLIDESVNVERKQNESCDKCFNLEAELLKSQNAHNDLLKREIHIEYLKYTQEQADILRGIVEQVNVKQPFDNALGFSCKHAQRIHELLVYVRDTCPNAINLSAKKVVVTPKNKVKKVRFAEPLTSSSNIIQSLLNANSELICATCKKSMFDGVHDMCFLDFVKNVNSRAKSAKKHKKQNIWKPTGHVFTEVGFKWKPTCKTFIIVGNSYPLTMITSANVVSPKKTTFHSVETQKPELKVYNMKPKNVKNVGNYSELMNFVCEFLGTVRFRNDHILKIMGYGDYQLACALGKIKKSSHQPKAEDTNLEKLYLLRMDLCGPMHVASINRKKTLHEFYENVGISHQTSVACTPQQNDVVERQNQTLVEAARIISGLIPYIVSQKPCIPPNIDDWDNLFQHMFDEYFNPLTITVSPVLVAAAPRAVDLVDSLVSTSIDQEAQSISIPSTQD
nr:integrase, catalytic region, zinc finger, CCHC-type, peptidase aspartic, catalytic [Tanacetum cinerariifolium]